MPATFPPHRKPRRVHRRVMLPIGLVTVIVAQTAHAQTGVETPRSTRAPLVDLGMMQESDAATRADPHSSEHHDHGLDSRTSRLRWVPTCLKDGSTSGPIRTSRVEVRRTFIRSVSSPLLLGASCFWTSG